MVIWIDAICINQADDEEKGWQVALMGDIYRNTSEVLAWLGPSANNSDKVLDHLDVLGSIAEACGLFYGIEHCVLVWTEMLRTWPNERDRLDSASSLDMLPIHLHGLEILLHAISGLKPHKYLIKLDDLEHLLRRPWWARIWVLQEISFPKQAQFVCGTKRISRSRFRAAFNAYHALRNALSSNQQLLLSFLTYQAKLSDAIPSNVQLMLSMWKLYQQKDFGLLEMLRATNFVPLADDLVGGPQSFLSTDPRDKVFALLDLINDREELREWGVFSDYTKSKERIYTEAMTAMLRQGHILLLSQACGVERQGGLPSWVPDWSKPSLVTLQVPQRVFSGLSPFFMACGSKQRCDMRLEPEKKRLLVMGTICDEVLRPGRVSRLPGQSTWTWPLIWLRGVEELTHLIRPPYSDSKTRLQTAARVAHAGMRSSGNNFYENNFYERVQMFPETMDLLEKLPQCVTDEGMILEIQQNILRDSVGGKGAYRTTGPQRSQTELTRISHGRSPFLTSKGRLGIGSMEAKKGDVVALISGAQTPFILRPVGERYMMVSEAYIDGIMDGEAVGDGKWGYIELE